MNTTRNVKPMKILLVEDNPADIEMARVTLEESGLDHELVVAEDGEEAITVLTKDDKENSSNPDLILLDINLPKLSGKEVLERIRQNDNLKDIPVMVLTSSHAKTDITDFYRLEADYYLTKPLDLGEFRSALGFDPEAN